MNGTLKGHYEPATPGARTWREARPLYIDGKHVTAEVSPDNTISVFVGTELVFEGTLPQEVTNSADVNPWIVSLISRLYVTVELIDGNVTYRRAPKEVETACRIRFELGNGIAAYAPGRKGVFLFDARNWWDGPSEVIDNGNGTLTYVCPFTGERDTFPVRPVKVSGTYGIERYAGLHFPNGKPCYGVTSSANGGGWTRDAAGKVFLYELAAARDVARILNQTVLCECPFCDSLPCRCLIEDECPQCGAMIPVSQFVKHCCV